LQGDTKAHGTFTSSVMPPTGMPPLQMQTTFQHIVPAMLSNPCMPLKPDLDTR